MIFLIFMLCNFHEQTNWMGGSGVEGPVLNWGTQYYQGDSITAANEGQVSLVATSWNYANWVEHMVESNALIWHHTQGFLPADVDKDGITDLVAHSSVSIKWYKHDGNYGFTPKTIGTANDGGIPSPCVYPCDMDGDHDIDVLVGNAGTGLGWWENVDGFGASWSWHLIMAVQCHRISGEDLDKDGDIDIIVCNNYDGDYWGVIGLLYNNGSQVFDSLVILDPYSISGISEAWRVYTADFNNDGYPDLYSSNASAFIYLNNGAGQFNLGWHQKFWGTTNPDFDGAWPSDINMDGYMDLVLAGYIASPLYHFYALINVDGSGTNFSLLDLGVGDQNYSDGAMARDIDLDGYPDIVGTCGKVGWIHQNKANPMTFTLRWIDDLIALNSSHWIYAAPLVNKCLPTIDLLVTEGGVGHKVYENKVVSSFAPYGELIASILQLTTPAQDKWIQWFGWEICYPGPLTVAFSWRGDSTKAAVNAKAWSTRYYATKSIDSVASPLSTECPKYFQYKVEFWPKASPLDIAVLYRVWLKDTICSAAIEEPDNKRAPVSLQTYGNKILLSVPHTLNNAKLSIYNIAGELVETLHNGSLSPDTYTFVPKVKTNGIYLVVLKWPEGKETTKFVKLK